MTHWWVSAPRQGPGELPGTLDDEKGPTAERGRPVVPPGADADVGVVPGHSREEASPARGHVEGDLRTFAPRLRRGDDTGTAGQAFYHGSGTARGLELFVQKKAGRHTGWLSYTLSQSEESFPTLETETYPSSQDQRHEL